jgi:hypothetical protein
MSRLATTHSLARLGRARLGGALALPIAPVQPASPFASRDSSNFKQRHCRRWDTAV